LEQSQNVLVWLRKVSFLLHICIVCRRLIKAQKSCAPDGKECNKCDLNGDPCFLLINHNYWSR
jgi:transcriptional regulatory protein LevR